MATIHITDIESAINYWRIQQPPTTGLPLAQPLQALAEVYGVMVFERQDGIEEARLPDEALQAWLAWYVTTPDTPCIAICSTSQGDEVCKGCGRSFAEVQYWTQMTPVEKRATWRRITTDGNAWRFSKYAERATECLLLPATTTA
ncbi:DUF3717 domain-containing protein [Rhodoferax sp.]|uniref:DUF3717 domain-containing protein n=1 Tax=Rhodoferax sp. TaxID=50421 RepID=UPI00260A4E4E|nr:DUF3717 domain-containing protein [Rhodoferax sp.]MDD2923913.1 DUF3717 domain-containing protein [Rhodoferax sp.]